MDFFGAAMPHRMHQARPLINFLVLFHAQKMHEVVGSISPVEL